MRGASRAPRPFSRPRGENATTRDECSEFSHPPSVHARATDATRAHPVAGIRAFFSRRGEPRASLTFLNPRLHPRRANVRANLASAPPQYRIVELEWGAVAFLGDGVPSPDAGPAHAPQVLERPDALVVLVSHTLTARDVGEAFTRACQAHAEPKARAIGLKMKLRELSVDAKFSFVLIDKVNGRVFAASTALSSPLALGHATDGAFQQSNSRTVTRFSRRNLTTLGFPRHVASLARFPKPNPRPRPRLTPHMSTLTRRHAAGDVHALGRESRDVVAPSMGQRVSQRTKRR